MSDDDLTLTVWPHPSMQIPFKFDPKDHPFNVKKSATIEDLMEMCEIEFDAVGAAAGINVELQIKSLWNARDIAKALRPDEEVGQHFVAGDTFGVHGDIETEPSNPGPPPDMRQLEQMWAVLQQQPPGPERELMSKQYVEMQRQIYDSYQHLFQSGLLPKMPLPDREQPLRFELNDRVVCNLGIRWVGGLVVGTDAENEEDWDYLIKTDRHPGLPEEPLQVPEDSDDICIQEVCFTAENMELIKGAAPEVPIGMNKQKLRFKTGDRVTCRVRNGEDGLETWCLGAVGAVNAPLPGPLHWGSGGLSGLHPSTVAYQVNLDNGTEVFCCADNYTLIRREGREPQERVKGVSKRLEERQCPDGSRVRFDHWSERQRTIVESSVSDSGSGDDNPGELTDAQKKALFMD